jgi:tyrosyl-tRNA synthetase
MDAVRYLRDVGKYFRMGPLLSRETVANRIKSDEGISYAEFSYSIIQAYDFYRLFEEEGCILQFGGSDQWGNITNGCDLVRKKTNNEVYGITMPLLLTKNGHKFGKS